MRIEFVDIEPGSMVAAWSLRKPEEDVRDKKPIVIDRIDSGVLTLWSEDLDEYLMLRIRKAGMLPVERIVRCDELAPTVRIVQHEDRVESSGRDLLRDGHFLVMVMRFLALWSFLMLAMQLVTWMNK